MALRPINWQQKTTQEGSANDMESTCSLQEAFLKFRQKKQEAIRERRRVERDAQCERAHPARMAALRKKFLDTAMSYMGVPYAKRYHDPDSPMYHSDLFLDCCGLVRRVLRDIKEELGFTVGPWNQAYQFDTLPMALSGPEEMQPGDLVFVSGIYNNTKAKAQRHHMVHVEIWVGDGERTLGARWSKGTVEIHNSYKFLSKSYHSMEYHFRSIDTWLQGVCRSFCPDHLWQVRQFQPGKHSVFSLQEDDQDCCPPEIDQDCCPAEIEQTTSPAEIEQTTSPAEIDQQRTSSSDSCTSLDESDSLQTLTLPVTTGASAQTLTLPVTTGASAQTLTLPVTTGASAQSLKPDRSSSTKQTTRASASSRPTSRGSPGKKHHQPKSAMAAHGTKTSAGRGGRTFLTVGGNAAYLVERTLTARRWYKLKDKTSTAFTLKWVELKQHIDFKTFREGEQIVNHFPNINLLTTKIGLLESLRAYERGPYCPRSVRIDSFVPLTYRMDVPTEKEEFLGNYKDGELWICKPTGANQGKGIFIVRELQQLLEKLETERIHCRVSCRPTARIVQKYLSTPLLLEGRKFDIRVFLLIVAAQPFLAFYHEGYIRLSCMAYDLASSDMMVHLTNQYQQKKHPLYSEKKEDTVWDFTKFQAYLTEHHQVPQDWVATTLTRRIQAIMLTCYHSVRHKLENRVGYFDLLGFDFMLDSDLTLWLIEVNINPAMQTNCEVLAAILPSLIEETLDIAIEVFDRCRRGKPVSPLTSIRNCVPLVM